jgi:hypothetical protein
VITDEHDREKLIDMKALIRDALADAGVHHPTIEIEFPEEECGLQGC